MAVSPNQSLAIADFMAKPMVDLDGGTLIDVKEHDEIDASDGCKVRVTEYKILSADGREELTRTCRRKLKIECNQSSRRTEITNGREARVEEKTKILYGDIDGFKVPIVRDNSQRLSLDTNNPQDAAISMVLQKTQENFASMLNEQRNQFISMFPDLFSEMRTTPCLFPAPSCTVETIINPDGSQTTRRCSSRAISSHYSKHVTYIDGVKQPEKTQFRAFMEYIGPEGGYKVTLSPDADLSEDEEETTSAISEVPEDQSAFVTVGRADQPKIREGAKTRFDKAWHAAKELVDSERRYVDKLRLLNEVFRKRIVDEKILEKEKISQLFANIASIHKFHEEHLLPALETSCREWHVTRRISDVLRKRAPFLKMYSEYAHNYKRATKVYDECLKKKKRFSQIVQSIEVTSCCCLAVLSRLYSLVFLSLAPMTVLHILSYLNGPSYLFEIL
ncbi:hypothetical protein AB6A40_005574 [Gnathostoma spinigerum]|uniref:DH domain-containing protein n=1 Tax=Gnathostoma spinigerum TaxID=75299 RepID=A0ABD6EGZ6_9BILA